MTKTNLITTAFIIFAFISLNIVAQVTWTDQVYNADVTKIEDNPMKGWMPGYPGIKSTFPYSINHFYIALNKVYTGWGQCNWTAFENELKKITDGGRHVVCRFWVHYPNQSTGLPSFLNSVVPSYSDGSPYYNDEDFVKAMEDFIALFGAKYNGDPRIVMIEAGLNGKWGEWHTYPENDRAMNQANKNRLTTAYIKAFPKTHIGIRQSNHVQTSQKMSFGYYDDSWAQATLCTGSWCFWNGNIVPDGITNIYKYHPIGGEMRPEIQSEIFDAWPNASKTTGGMNMENLETCIKTTHLSFMKTFGGLFNRTPSATEWANGLRSHKMLGYQFFVRSVQILPDTANNFTVNLNIQNRGVAPIYYNWQVEFSAINTSTKAWTGILGTTNWSTDSIYPSTVDYFKTYKGLITSNGTYKILMRFKNPLDAYSASARALRFVNEAQDDDKLGWLTLGTVTIESSLKYPNSISVTPSTLSLSVIGQTGQLNASVLPVNTFQDIIWTSSDSTVAMVNSKGLVTAKKNGNITITASTVNGLTSTCAVTVKTPVIAVSSIGLNISNDSLLVGKTKQLISTVLPTNATNKAVSWSTSNSIVATVSNTGIITALKAGNATITATSNNGLSATCTLTVQTPYVAVVNIGLNVSSSNILKNETKQLFANVLPSNATNQEVIWSSSNDSVVTVSNKGYITALKSGNVTISAKTTDGNKTTTCNVVVYEATTTYSVSHSYNNIRVTPNPAKDIVSINLELNNNENVIVEIIDIRGMVVFSENVIARSSMLNHQISIKSLYANVYFMRVQCQSWAKVIKFIKE